MCRANGRGLDGVENVVELRELRSVRSEETLNDWSGDESGRVLCTSGLGTAVLLAVMSALGFSSSSLRLGVLKGERKGLRKALWASSRRRRLAEGVDIELKTY